MTVVAVAVEKINGTRRRILFQSPKIERRDSKVFRRGIEWQRGIEDDLYTYSLQRERGRMRRRWRRRRRRMPRNQLFLSVSYSNFKLVLMQSTTLVTSLSNLENMGWQ